MFCVDEKTAIQGLDRLDPVLPLSPGRAERHGFEYYRHGTLSLYAALDTQSGKVLGKTAARHTSQEFVKFLTAVVERAPAREVHIILDNLWAHKSQVVRDFLATHPNVHSHFKLLPFPSSGLAFRTFFQFDRVQMNPLHPVFGGQIRHQNDESLGC